MELRCDIKGANLGSVEQLTWVVLVETWGPNTRKRSAPFGLMYVEPLSWMYVEPSIHQPEVEWNEHTRSWMKRSWMKRTQSWYDSLDSSEYQMIWNPWLLLSSTYMKLYFLPSFGSCSAKRASTCPTWHQVRTMGSGKISMQWTKILGFPLGHGGLL